MAATVIDELVLVFGLDPSKFTEGQRKAVEALRKLEEQATKSGKEAEGQSKKLLDFFVNTKKQAVELLALFYGGRGVGEIVHHITQLDASTARFARTTNISARELALWQSAFEQVGGSAEDARAVIGGLSDAVQDFLTNPSHAPEGLLAVIQRLNLKPEQISNPAAILRALGEYAQTPEMQAHPEQFASFARLLPRMNQTGINLLLEGAKKFLDAADKVVTTTKEGGVQSEKFIQSLALLETAATGVARVMLDYLLPAMNTLAGMIPNWLKPEGQGIDFEKVNKDLGTDDPNNFGKMVTDLRHSIWEYLFPPATQLSTAPPGAGTTTPKTISLKPSVKSGGIGELFNGATGYQIIEGGVVVGSGTFPAGGARSAAAASNVRNSSTRNNTNTSTVNIGEVNVNAPHATDSQGIAASVKPALTKSLGAPLNSGLQ